MNTPGTTDDTPAQPPRGAGCWLLAAIVAIVVCIAAVVLFNIAMHGFFRAVIVGETEAVESPDAWPKPLKDLVKDAARAKVGIKGVRVHCTCQAFDPEYIWQMKATRGLFDLLKARWQLSPTSVPTYGVFCGKSNLSGDVTPDWWSPKKNARTRFYASKRSLEGKGDIFVVAVDEEREIIFVHYHYNF
jgi:hypothetical protein